MFVEELDDRILPGTALAPIVPETAPPVQVEEVPQPCAGVTPPKGHGK